MKIKEWKFRQMMDKVLSYGDLWENIDVKRTGDSINSIACEDGFVELTCRVNVLKETEKAVQVRIADSWTEWIPKSCIA